MQLKAVRYISVIKEIISCKKHIEELKVSSGKRTF